MGWKRTAPVWQAVDLVESVGSGRLTRSLRARAGSALARVRRRAPPEYSRNQVPPASRERGTTADVGGPGDRSVYAIDLNGTKKREFLTGDFVTSSPAIGADGTIYVGSWDYNLYAVGP